MESRLDDEALDEDLAVITITLSAMKRMLAMKSGAFDTSQAVQEQEGRSSSAMRWNGAAVHENRNSRRTSRSGHKFRTYRPSPRMRRCF